MKRFKGVWYCLLIGLAVIFIGANLGFSADIPKMMTWTAYDVGSSGYMQVGHVLLCVAQIPCQHRTMLLQLWPLKESTFLPGEVRTTRSITRA